MYRRTLLLYDGVGLDLPETAAETEASTPAAANRLLHAREAVATRLPELAEPKELHRRLAEVASAERLHAAKPTTVRWGGEQRARHWTRAAIAFTVVLIGATTLTLRTAPDHYEPPLAPGATVHGVPPRVAPGPLSAEELALRAKLKGRRSAGRSGWFRRQAEPGTTTGSHPVGMRARSVRRRSSPEKVSRRGSRGPASPSRSASCRP